MDHDADAELVRVDERAAEAISASCTQGPLACIQVWRTAFSVHTFILAGIIKSKAMQAWHGY